MGPFDPNYYGYAFTVDGAQVADPGNRTVSFYQAPPIWPGPTSAWSWVMVPGPAADYMAETRGLHGAVSTVSYYSSVLESQKQMLVYTPPGYNHDRRDYPVLYLCPGGGGANTDWTVNMRANFILDNLIAQRKVRPMIVVMPEYNVRSCPDFATDVFPQQLVHDVIPAAEKMFRVARRAKNRALAGLSSGGGCVFNTLLTVPEEFDYFGTFSPNWPAMEVIVQNREDRLTNPRINRTVELLWITRGGSGDNAQLPTYLATLDRYRIDYTYVPGTT
jgi:enterochelin esterase family protein